MSGVEGADDGRRLESEGKSVSVIVLSRQSLDTTFGATAFSRLTARSTLGDSHLHSSAQL